MTSFINALQGAKKVDERMPLPRTSTGWGRWDNDKFNIFVFAKRCQTAVLPMIHCCKRKFSQALFEAKQHRWRRVVYTLKIQHIFPRRVLRKKQRAFYGITGLEAAIKQGKDIKQAISNASLVRITPTNTRETLLFDKTKDIRSQLSI